MRASEIAVVSLAFAAVALTWPEAVAVAEPGPRVRTDRYGEPLPEGAVLRLGTVRLRPDSQIERLAFSPDAKTLASSDGTLWEVPSGKPLRHFRPPCWHVNELRFSPQGQLLAIGAEDDGLVGPRAYTLWLWDVATRRKLQRLLFVPKDAEAHPTTFSPDYKTVACLAWRDGRLEFWDAGSGKHLHRIHLPGGFLSTAAFSPDGKLLATGHDKEFVSSADRGAEGSGPPLAVRLWDVATGKELRALKTARADVNVRCLCFTPDSKALVVGDSRTSTVRMWEVATGKELCRFEALRDWITSLAVSPDGKTLAVGGGDRPVTLLNLGTGQPLGPAEAHRDSVEDVAFSPDGRFVATAGRDHSVWLWDARTGAPCRRLSGHCSVVRAVSFQPTGRLLASAAEGGRDKQSQGYAVRLWDPLSGKSVHQWQGPGPPDWGLCLAFCPDGQTLAVGCLRIKYADRDVGEVELRDPATGRRRLTVPARTGGVVCAAFSPDGRLLACGGDELTARLHALPGGTLLRPLECPPPGHAKPRAYGEDEPVTYPQAVTGLAFTPDGRMVAGVQYNSTPVLWEAATGKVRLRRFQEFRSPSRWGRAMALAPDGRWLACVDERSRICLWDTETLRLAHRFAGHRGPVYALAFAPDGQRLASASEDTTVLVWDLGAVPRPPVPPSSALRASEPDALWVDLAGEDAAKAYQAILRLAAAPAEAVPFLNGRLRPVPHAAAADIARLVGELDHRQFAVREQASERLRALEDAAEPALRQALQTRPSAELIRRGGQLLEGLRGPAWLRQQRALEALEHAATPEARRVLEGLAQGAPQAELTWQAKAAVERLAKAAAHSGIRQGSPRRRVGQPVEGVAHAVQQRASPGQSPEEGRRKGTQLGEKKERKGDAARFP